MSKKLKSRLQKSCQRGWGLTETLLTLGAISIMSVAIYTVFKPTDASAQVRIEQDNLRDLSRSVDRSFGMLGSFSSLSTARVEEEGLAPNRMSRAGAGLKTNWGTSVDIRPYANPAKGIEPNTAFSVTYPGTSAEVCAGLASAMGRDAFDILVDNQSIYNKNGMSPSLAANQCAPGNVTMEFVFHSGLVAGQAVAAPPLILPPAPPSVSPPPSSPPVMSIPGNPDVDDATPGTLPSPPASSTSPPPAPPPLTAPPSPPPPAPITYTPPPPVPVTPPGAQCVVPASWVDSRFQSPHCASGQYGQRHQQSDRDVTYTCPEAWDNPVEKRDPWSSWYDTTNTCTSCPTLAPQVEYQWQTSTGSCPSGQLGTVSHEYEQSRSQTRTYVCAPGTLELPDITYGDWSSWANTGNTRNPINTCEDICVVPSPNPESQTQNGTAERVLACLPGETGKIEQTRPQHRTRTRTWSCPGATGAPTNSGWSAYGDWTQTGSWTTVSNTCDCPPGKEIRDGACVPARIDCPADEQETRYQHNVNLCGGVTAPDPNSIWGGNVTVTQTWRRQAVECTTAGIVWGDWKFVSSNGGGLIGGCLCETIPYYGDPLAAVFPTSGGWIIDRWADGNTMYQECK